MATDVERLVIAFEARTASFEKELKRVNAQAAKQSTQIERRFRDMNKNIEGVFARGGISQSIKKDLDASVAAVSAAEGKLSQSTASMRGMMTGLAGIFAARELVNMADTWSDISARVGIAVGEMSQAPAVMERIYDLAQSTYSGLQQTAESFIANSTALKELGYNTNQQLDYTEALNNALVVSGAKADRAASVSNALSKAMASGKLSGDQLNTVIETGGRVAEVLAAELGVGVNQLRAIGAEGKITSQVIYNALTKRMEELSEQAESMPATMGDAFQLIQNSALKSVGALDQTGKVSEKLAGLLGGVANNMDAVAVAGLAMATVLASRQIGNAANNLGAYAKSTHAAMAASRVAAIEEQAVAVARVRSAEAAFMAAKANGLVTASHRNLSRELLASRMALSAANAQLAATGPIATASAAAVRGFSTAVSALGGPVGIGLIALTGIMYALSARSQEAEERANRYAEAIRKAGEDSDYAGLGIEKTAEKLFAVAEGLTEAQRAIKLDEAKDNVTKSLAALDEAFNAAGRGLLGLKTYFSPVYGELGTLTQRFKDGELSVEDYNAELDRLSKIDPDITSLIAKMQDIAKQAAATRGEVNALNIASAGVGGGSGKGGKLIPFTDAEKLEGDRAYKLNFDRRFGSDLAKNLEAQAKAIADAEKKANGGGGRKKSGRGGNKKDDLQREIEQIKERWAMLNQEAEVLDNLNPLINDYEYAITKAKTAQELLNAAQKAGLKDTPELRAEIEALAEGYAQTTVAVNQLAETHEQARQASDFLKGSMMDAFQSMIPAIETGNKALDGFLNTLMDAVNQALLLGKGPLAGLFGGGTGLLGTIFGFAKGGVAAHGRPQPMKTFARGGVSRTAAIFGEAGPEAAVPLPDGRRIPVDLNLPKSTGSGAQNVHVTVGVSTDGNGNLMPFVESVARNEASRSTAQLSKNIPTMVDNRSNARQVRGTRG
ncbi:tape measure protein [Paenochrobactrum pullorum]|uniref:tape measure protein n=1 Tax=Paenochrobactrum pullorum TaxID=1324351 RepID=UPI0035BBD032